MIESIKSNVVLATGHRPIWDKAQPYLLTRSNDRHTLYCYAFARQLLISYPAANAEVVLPAILLHDIGWSTVPEDKQLLSFGPHMRYPELRRRHETEGARLAGGILRSLACDLRLIEEIQTIIDGHDTRQESLSLHDSLVRDADKLWRYTPFGLQTLSEWFGYSIPEQMELLRRWLDDRFFTETAVIMARGLWAALDLEMAGF